MVDCVALGVGAALCEVVARILTRPSSALLRHDDIDGDSDNNVDSDGDDDDARDVMLVDDDYGEIAAQILDGDGDDDNTDDDVWRQIDKCRNEW